MTNRRTILLAGAAAAAVVAMPALAEYPDKPVRLIVAWDAGGGTDIVARYIADTLSRETGAEIVVENRPGAGGVIGSAEVAQSAPDGTTMMLATADSHTIAPLLRSNLGYDAAADFDPVYLVATLSFSMVARPGLDASTPQDIVHLASTGDGLTVGTWGIGSTAHIAAEMFNQATGVKLVHVPYQGSAPAINDLQNDQIDLMFNGPGTVTSGVEAGTMKFIGAASDKRIGLAPDFPTMKEQGIDGVEMETWFGIDGPAGLPDEVASWWSTHMADVMADPAFLELLRTRGMDPVGEGAEAFQTFLDAQSTKLGAVIEKAGITVE